MTLDELIRTADLTLREAVILDTLLRAPDNIATMAEFTAAIEKNIRVEPVDLAVHKNVKYSPDGEPLVLNRYRVRASVNNLSIKLLKSKTFWK